MPSSEFTLNDRVYRYKRPVLSLVKRFYHMQPYATQAEKVEGILKNEGEEYATFKDEWTKFTSGVLESSEGLALDNLTIYEVLSVIAGFFVLGQTAANVKGIFPASTSAEDNESPEPTK
jgi:hypothetical protein